MVVRYSDGFAAYVVGVTFGAGDVRGDLRVDHAETLELAWFPTTALPDDINP